MQLKQIKGAKNLRLLSVGKSIVNWW